MKHLWKNYSAENFYCAENEIGGGYEEIIGAADGEVKVNPLLRFREIFFALSEVADEKIRRELENILLHFLAQLDLQSCTHKFTLTEKILRREIESGKFGKRVAENFAKLTSPDREKICALLRRQEENHNRKLLFSAAIHEFFSGAKVYFYADAEVFLVYLPQEKTESAEVKLQLIEDLFFDILNRKAEVFFGAHFGILGQSDTMRLGEVILY